MKMPRLRLRSFIASVLVLVTVSACFVIAESQDGDSDPILELLPCSSSSKRAVRGVWVTTANEKGEQRRVANFRGLRFSPQPVRFAAGSLFDLCATSPTDTNSVFNATTFSNSCPQLADVLVVGSEDCLFLNIYVPEAIYNILKAGNPQNQLFPVNHYFYGGGLTSGDAAGENHNFFAAFCGDSVQDPNGCIALTTNYRLSINGFIMSSAFQPGQANFGILDQILSLQWTQKWIQSFGGNKSKVTTSGQSSGGTSIFALMSSPMVSGLFRAAFSMSGSPNITISREDKIAQDLPILQGLGCAPSSAMNDAQVIQCLRDVPIDTLIKAQPGDWGTPNLWSMANLKPGGRHFYGLPCVDGVVLTHSFRDSIRVGLNQDVTLLIQSEGQEDNLVTPRQPVSTDSQLQWRQFLNETFAAWGGSGTAETMANEIYNLYAPESTLNPQMAYDSINTDYGLTCASPELAKQFTVPHFSRDGKKTYFGSADSFAMASHRNKPIYISVNQWAPEKPYDFKPWSLAFHVWDYFAATHQWALVDPQPRDFQLGFLLRATWYHLMRDGDLEKMTLLKWEPAVPNGAVDAVDYKTFVYSRPDRFPFFANSGMVQNYKRKNCDTFKSFGMGETYWWCD